MDEPLIIFGGAIKALGNGRFSGPLVTFSGPDSPDLALDFFDATTDFGIDGDARLPLYYNHGMDTKMGKARIGSGEVKQTAANLWYEGQLNLRNDYEKAIYKLVESGRLGLSSGAASHLVEREAVGKSFHIKQWVLAEASLTPEPCEPSHSVTALKNASSAKSFKALLAELEAEEAQVLEAQAVKSLDALAPEPIFSDVVSALKSLPFTDYLAEMGAITEEFARRVSWVHEERHVKQGRVISAGNAQMISDACNGMQGHLDKLMGLVNPTTLQKEDAEEDGLDDSGKHPAETLLSAPVQQQALQAYFRHNTTDTARNFALIAQNAGGTISF